ncbi:MAG: single-stranded DNA-binding protein [Ardenticatenaceae bacterium]|nr:single-stranded DNA-binding protein [Ardenticatenaceae bacterium]MCB8947540.1 single-stranded DNA-binding protein [Ardenticatenaceae bacterium]
MYQKIIVVGNLGSDPEMRYMPDGTAVTSFSVATNRRWTDRSTGQPVDETTWFRVSVWGRQAETTNEYLSKGRKVLVEGQLTPDRNTGGPRLWSGQDGTVRASFEIRADTVRFLGGREDGGSYGGDDYDGGGAPAQEEDDIPF